MLIYLLDTYVNFLPCLFTLPVLFVEVSFAVLTA
jgi:hypothetical protein